MVSDQTLIRRVPTTEQLICLEPAKDVIAKVGVTNQWLKVQDSQKKQGYVAAWYVKYASGSTAQAVVAATNNSPAKPGTVSVKATAEMVALRNQPVVSDATLIKRVPINYQFIITEAGGETKIGKNDQWIKVKDMNHEGYVAAWFVARV
jgi:hypothetical protein